jgi:hypothetical protein
MIVKYFTTGIMKAKDPISSEIPNDFLPALLLAQMITLVFTKSGQY